MRDETQKTVISVLRAAISEWRRRDGLSRETVVDEIVKKHNEIGGPVTTNIVFAPQSRDVFGCMRANMERVYRWLDDESKDCTLLPTNFVPSILAAMPSDLRLQCVNLMLRPLGLEACVSESADASSFNAAAHASGIIKESAEAATKILALGSTPTNSQVEDVCKEIADVRESATETLRALRAGVLH